MSDADTFNRDLEISSTGHAVLVHLRLFFFQENEDVGLKAILAESELLIEQRHTLAVRLQPFVQRYTSIAWMRLCLTVVGAVSISSP